MSPYRKKGELTWVLTVVTGDPACPYKRLSSGTRDKPTAEQMQAMLDLFGERGKRWLWIRDAILAKRIRIPEVYDAYVAGRLEDLQERLADVDLWPVYQDWLRELARQRASGTLAEETVRKYTQQSAVLVGPQGPWWRSTLTAPHLKQRLEAVPGSGTNRRRHAAAWTSLLEYVVGRGHLEGNPLRTFKLPKSNKTRLRYAEWPHVVRLLHAMPPGVHQALAAIRHGAGLEMQAALRMRRADVDLGTKVVWAHGAKTDHRDRQTIVLDDDCWALFADYVRGGGFLPDAPLFPVTAAAHGAVQREACTQLRADGIDIRAGYTLHAARHSFAVEMVRRGYGLKLISVNLGHANERLCQQLYAKFEVRTEDLLQSARRAQGGPG